MSPFNKEIDMNTQRTLKLSLLALPLWALISCGGVQLLFEAAYLVAQGGLGAVEFPRGGGEIQRPAHGEKAEKLVLVHDKKLLSGGGTSVQPQYSRK